MTARSQDADLVIAGAGCAGLSVLWHTLELLDVDDPRHIVVVDRDPTPGDDRTWAFWGPSGTPFAWVADRSWDRLRVRFPGWEETHALGTQSYWRVPRRDFDTAVLELAATRPQVEIVAADIVDVRDEGSGGAVVTSAGDVRAPTVLQNVMLSPDDRLAPVRHPLRQHFGGWEVVTQRPVFEPDVATFMDFDTDQHDGVAFFYVLPDAEDRALVEHTVFSTTPRGPDFYDDHVRAHLEQRGAGEVTITRREYGSIPMEDRRLHQTWGDHVFNLGGVGGMTKPTTGYTFQRIQAQTRHIAAAWVSGAPTPLPPPPRRYRMTDRMLLHVLHRQSHHGRPIFEQLFRTMPFDQLLGFLDEQTSLGQDLTMMARMPWAPFMRAGVAELSADALAWGRSLRS